jgi:hypothetical protein
LETIVKNFDDCGFGPAQEGYNGGDIDRTMERGQGGKTVRSCRGRPPEDGIDAVYF